MRSLISYDDLSDSKPPNAQNATTSPPKKKQRSNRNKKSGHSGGNPNVKVHGTQAQKTQPPISFESQPNSSGYRIQEESRQLTHSEIWDDSALIEAWNAAAEEYEALNGPDKSWKAEPIHKSPLWYNIPPKQKDTDTSEFSSAMMPSIPAPFASHFESSEEMEVEDEDEDEENSRPVDFETFVPQHDPSLTLNQNIADQTTFAKVIPSPPQDLSSISVDQAFQNAMGAWYWAGYWTGIYHATSRPNARANQDNEDGDEEKGPEIGVEVEDGDMQAPDVTVDQTDLIPT